MRTAVIFDNCGPYHLARLRAAARVCELSGVQIRSRSTEYAWDAEVAPDAVELTTVFHQDLRREVPPHEMAGRIGEALDNLHPQVVFIPGWSSQAAFAALRWCLRHRTPAVAMCESTEWDEVRVGWKEWMKRQLVRLFSAALVGGGPHKEYLVRLGMPESRVFLGYDAVDNSYFTDKAAEIRSREAETRSASGLPANYFLASARFIEKKNLPGLLQAYARYREQAGKPDAGHPASDIWNLVLLGDGPLRKTLDSQLSALNLHGSVRLPGFMQYPELPMYYALASAFIQASTTEPWGLVVNEAMASGLPVLVSDRCGCARDLAQAGRNGFTFDPTDIPAMAEAMLRMAALPEEERQMMGAASRQIVGEWGPERFARGMIEAAGCALEQAPIRTAWSGRLTLEALLRR